MTFDIIVNFLKTHTTFSFDKFNGGPDEPSIAGKLGVKDKKSSHFCQFSRKPLVRSRTG